MFPRGGFRDSPVLTEKSEPGVQSDAGNTLFLVRGRGKGRAQRSVDTKKERKGTEGTGHK